MPKRACSPYHHYRAALWTSVSELGLLASIVFSSAAGSAVGFATGLVPGLHVNNIAAATVACAGGALAFFAVIGDALGFDGSGAMVSCFLVSALVSHCFSEAVPNTYVGIPSGDVVSVLPAHRLAKAGLGWTAVKASVDGSLAGVVLGLAALVPACLLLGPSVGLYGHLRTVMGHLIVALSAALVLSDGLRVPATRSPALARLMRTSTVLVMFLASGVLGVVVLDTDYFASDMPGCTSAFVPRSSLLLPLFAGLFGLPTLMLSMGSRQVRPGAASCACKVRASARGWDVALSLVGAVLVGWVPGMTSGTSATLCSSVMRRPSEDAGGVESSRDFIWLYSAISSAGAVMSVGALYTILRSRSGVMDAVTCFLMPEPVGAGASDLLYPAALLLSMMFSAMLSHAAMTMLRDRLVGVGAALCSRRLAVCAAVFVCSLVALLTGLRGLFLMAAACSLGVMPPTMGVRRIHLMGCLLVPVAIMFLTW